MTHENKSLDESNREGLGHSYIELSDGTTHYELSGPDGEQPIVLLHGGTACSWYFDEVVERLNAAGHRTLRYDQFGRGWSDRPDVEYTQAFYQRQLDDLLAALDITRYDLLGYSWGGAIATNKAHRHPDQVDRLILVAPVVHYRAKPAQLAISRLGGLGELFLAKIGIKTVIRRGDTMLQGHPRHAEWTAAFKAQTHYEGFQRSLLSMIRHSLTEDYTETYRAVGAA